MSHHFDLLRLAGEGSNSNKGWPPNRLMRLMRNAPHLPPSFAAESNDDESDLLTVVRVFRRRWRTAAA